MRPFGIFEGWEELENVAIIYKLLEEEGRDEEEESEEEVGKDETYEEKGKEVTGRGEWKMP